jgi:hypothetical protein
LAWSAAVLLVLPGTTLVHTTKAMEMTGTTRPEESVVEPIDVEISAKGMFLPTLVG